MNELYDDGILVSDKTKNIGHYQYKKGELTP